MMPIGRTELLIPRVVDLGEAAEPLAGGDRVDERKIAAVAALKASLAEKRGDIAKVDYSSIRRRLIELNAIPEDEIEDAEMDEACRLAYDIYSMEHATRAFNDDYFTLLALEESLGRLAIERFRNHHPFPTWLLCAEVSVREAWVRHHEELLRDGQEVKEPFRCRVGKWLSPERKHDREYYLLIRYLHGLRACCGEEWILSERRETPDFELRRRDNEVIGAEMSEVPISQEWADAQRIAVRVTPVLRQMLRPHRKSLYLYDPEWSQIYENIDQIQALLSEALSTGCSTIANPAIPLDAEVRPSDGEPTLWTSSRRGETGEDIREHEAELAEAIRAAIRKKLVKDNGKPRKLPVVRPCDLVLYPNGAGYDDLDRVADLARERMDIDYTTHFDRIWLVSEEAIVQVC